MSEDMLNESLVERLKLYSTKTAENIDNIRSVAARLHSRTASQGMKFFRYFSPQLLKKKVCLYKI